MTGTHDDDKESMVTGTQAEQKTPKMGMFWNLREENFKEEMPAVKCSGEVSLQENFRDLARWVLMITHDQGKTVVSTGSFFD